MSQQVVKVRRGAVAPCMTCPLCSKLLREATTIIECLHTFCRKCIYKKLSDEEMDTCPVCQTDLGCSPLEKLRADHNLQDIRAKIFPNKKIKAKSPNLVATLALPALSTLPAKRKERSLSSLVINTPKVSPQTGMTGRRSKLIARKASRGTTFTIEKLVEDHPESSGSPESLNKFTQNMKQNSTSGGPSSHPSLDKGRKNNSEGKRDLWKPLTCLVEAANRSKSSKFSTQGQGSLDKSDEQNTYDNEGSQRKAKNKEFRKKSKVGDEKNCSDYTTPPEPERPKKLRKTHQKAQNFGEFKVPPQVVLDASSAKFEKRDHPVWFSLVASDELDGDASPLPQISASYLRIKDGSMPVSFIQKYLKRKLALTSEAEVDIKCMGQTVIPTLTMDNLVDLWFQATSTEKVMTIMGSPGKDFVMVLGYSRRCPDC